MSLSSHTANLPFESLSDDMKQLGEDLKHIREGMNLKQMREHIERMQQDLDGIAAQVEDHKHFFDNEAQWRLRAFIKQTTNDLVIFIESHHELRAEAYGSAQHNHVAENISPVHLNKLGIPHRYWTPIEQVKDIK